MLMVSRLHTFSMKGIRVPNRYIVLVLVGVGLMAASLVSQPWLTLTAFGVTYLVSIPFSMRRFHVLEQKAAEMKAGVGAEPAPVAALAPAGKRTADDIGTIVEPELPEDERDS